MINPFEGVGEQMLPMSAHLADEVDHVIGAAGAGSPQLLVIEGPQGSGKTTLLSSVLHRCAGWAVLTAEASDDDVDSYSTLGRLGIVARPFSSPLVAAQAIRERLHSLNAVAPAVITLDDLQWADPETVDALLHLIDRSGPGDRLLVVVASHLLAPGMRDRIASRVEAGSTRRILLDGLSLDEATGIARDLRPWISSAAIERSWRMTEGNLLYFTSVLTEYDVDEISEMPFLPAPETFSRAIARRLDRLGHAPTELIRAIAVLGSSWHPLLSAAEVAKIQDAVEAADALLASGLIAHRVSTELGGAVRPVHALVRAAVYQRIPSDRRNALHLAAASLELDDDAALSHRVAATTRLDDGLADELAVAARRNHDSGAFHRAAEEFRWSSTLSGTPDLRRERLLDSLYERVFANDRDGITEQSGAVRREGDPRVALLGGAQAALANRWHEALAVLSPVIDAPADTIDPLVRYRSEVLAAWSAQGVGMSPAWIEERLRRAASTAAFDPTLHGFVTLTTFQLRGRAHDMAGVRAFTAQLPPRASAVPLESSFELLTRGLVAALSGDVARAKEDLSEMERRFQLGVMDVGDGLTHAFLGMALWLNGEEQLAETKFRLAREMMRASANPAASSLTVLGMVSVGDFARADDELERIGARLAADPWQEAIRLYTIALVARLHAAGDASSQAAALGAFEEELGEHGRDVRPASYPVWLVYRALLPVWAGRLREAEALATRLLQLPDELPWVAAAGHWLSGLIAERNDQRGRARRELDDALRGGIDAIPILHAHTLADRARIADDPRDLDRAVELYRALHQLPYVDRLSQSRGRGASPPTLNVLGTLSEREQDVLTLITNGLSYEQVARNLFISRSTVSFHLSNIYAKTGVNSRHALTELVRSAC
jgi:DNA-binding CsgD family transcriptional regulator